MNTSMFYVYVTLATGAVVSGVINARSYEDAREQICETEQAQTATAVLIERAY